ncbi:MAG TPA: hypothetical protein VHV82_11700 [Sporichthyaceae bacterium]|jgi:hypothetical protein|nr:hypothetical protein [Sporichthyaceae bacterium]
MVIVDTAGYDNPTRRWNIVVRHLDRSGNCGIGASPFGRGERHGVNNDIRR